MKITLAILAILLSSHGWAYHCMVKNYAQINRPSYLRSLQSIISLFVCVIIAFFFSIMSFGLAWYWAILIAVPASFIVSLIVQIIHEEITKANFTMVTGMTAFPIVSRVIIGLILSIIAFLI